MISRKTVALQRKVNHFILLPGNNVTIFQRSYSLFQQSKPMKILKSLLNRMQMSHFTVVRINASGFFIHRPPFNDTRVPKGRKRSTHLKDYLHYRFP